MSDQARAKIIYTFLSRTFIENITIRPNGHLLLTTFKDGSLFNLDPSSANPQAQLVAQLPDASSLTGIVQIEPDVYAITGGHQPGPMKFHPSSLKCFRVDLTDGIENVIVSKICNVSGPQLLNGMASNSSKDTHVLLSVDSIDGSIVRIDAKTGAVDIPVRDTESMGPSERNQQVPLGVNGAKVRDGHLYFTNSSRELFGRVKIDSPQFGKVEILVSNEDAGEPMPYDDFDFAPDGSAYLTRHSDAVFRVRPSANNVDGKWEQELFLGGNGDESILKSPTSLAVSKDGSKMYVACAGKLGEFVGFVVEVVL